MTFISWVAFSLGWLGIGVTIGYSHGHDAGVLEGHRQHESSIRGDELKNVRMK
jgi:hypothetical protein